MIQKIQNILDKIQKNLQKTKPLIVLIIIVVLIFFLLTINAFGKGEEEKYIMKLMNGIKETNATIPKIEEKIMQEEEKLRKYRLLRRCYKAQLERIEDQKIYEIDYCKNSDNLEQFSVLNEWSEDVSDEFLEKEVKNETSFLIQQASAKENIVGSNSTDTNGVKKTVYVIGWDRNDRRQARLQYLYEKSGYDKDIILTFLGENGTFELKRRSATAGNGYYDYGLCQLNYKRHKKFIDSDDFDDAYKQLDYCLGVRNDAKKKGRISTTFYAYNVRRKQESRVVFE